jgi:hypothetical protein
MLASGPERVTPPTTWHLAGMTEAVGQSVAAEQTTERFLRGVVELSERRAALGAEAWLAELARLATRADDLRHLADSDWLARRFADFARARFALADEPDESREAGEEVETLGLVLAAHGGLVAPALRAACVELSGALGVPGAAQLLGRLLKRLRQVAHDEHDSDLTAWVAAVVEMLPGDET